jgi:rod shape-determining protein MreC
MKKITTRQWLVFTSVLLAIGILLLALSGYLNIIIGKAATPFVSVQTWVSQRYMAVYDFFTVPRDVYTLRQQNTALQNQVSQLQTQVLELQQELSNTEILYALLNYARTSPEKKYVAASVIGRDPSPFLSYLIIDHGSDDGIRAGMPVVTDQGLVGKIDAVTATAARIQLITDVGSVVNITLNKAKIDGQIIGSVTGDLSLGKVSSNVDLTEGDLAITNGLGGTYPADIVVGQILSPTKSENDLFQSATVQPVVDFANLKAVLIITNFTPVNIAPLENSTE